jgi:hypothetical protein
VGNENKVAGLLRRCCTDKQRSNRESFQHLIDGTPILLSSYLFQQGVGSQPDASATFLKA